MHENTKATLTNMDTWKRGLFMVVFSMISGLAKLVLILVAIFQFFTLLFKGQLNIALLPLGQNLSTYQYQINLFLTFKTDAMPFPFIDFPDGTPQSELNEDNQHDIDTDEATTTHQQTVAATDENIQDVEEQSAEDKSAEDKSVEDETAAQNNTKDAALID